MLRSRCAQQPREKIKPRNVVIDVDGRPLIDPPDPAPNSGVFRIYFSVEKIRKMMESRDDD